jgi:superfamily I DNA/RNA helicase
VDIYVGELNSASARLGAGLVFHDARDHETFTNEPAFRLSYAVLRLTTDEDDFLAWRTLLALAVGIGSGTVGALYDEGPGNLATAVRSIAATNRRVRDLRDAALVGRDELIAAESRAAAWNILAEVIVHIDPDATLGTWRERVDQVVPEDDPTSAAAQLLARFQDRVYVTVADTKAENRDVLVYTTFGAKGQQWRHVFIVGAYSQGFQDGPTSADGLRKLYVTLTRAMETMTITLSRFVRFTALEMRLPTYTPVFTPELVEAFGARGIQIEVDPG